MFNLRPLLLAAIALAVTAGPGYAAPPESPYRVGPPTFGDRIPASLRALIPPSFAPLLDRPNRPGRPKPGATSMFEPGALLPVLSQQGTELSLCWGRTARDSVRGDQERAQIVAVFVGAGW